MNARVFQPVAPPETGVVAWSWRALALAAGAGLLAVVSPPASLLALALLAARALVHSPNRQLELSDFAGPLLATLIAGAFVGISGAVGVIFAWRLFSDARWSIGESRRLAALAGLPPQRLWASELHLWLTPAFGLALVAYTSPHMIAGLPLDLPHVPLMIPVAVGCLAAGAAGVLAAPLWTVTPTMGAAAVMPAFVIVTIGGLGSYVGAIIAGLLVGVVTAVAVQVEPQASTAAMYLLMVAVLLLRPRGLFGERWEKFE